MHRIEVSLPDLGLVGQLRRMRGWLDENKLMPIAFYYEQRTDRVVMRVAFLTEDDARAFAAQFQGRDVAD